MILLSGVTKATGLLAALAELGLSAEHTVAIGDAENDHAFLAACGLFGRCCQRVAPRSRRELISSRPSPAEPVSRKSSDGSSCEDDLAGVVPEIAWTFADRFGMPCATKRLVDKRGAGMKTRASNAITLKGEPPSYLRLALLFLIIAPDRRAHWGFGFVAVLSPRPFGSCSSCFWCCSS